MAKFSAGIICMILMLCLADPIMATSYSVGNSAGWAFGVDYGTWASGKTFQVGDTLVFSYGSGHDVSEVSASDYAACNGVNAINTDSSGATTIPLKTTGKHYFICGAMGHCAGGMKLAITVTAGSDTATPPESTIAPSPSTTAVTESPLSPAATSAPSPSTIVVTKSPLSPAATSAPSPSTTAVTESPLSPAATSAPSPSTIVVSQPPLMANSMTSITTPAAVSEDVPPSSSAATLSTVAAHLITCSAVIFKLVLA